MAPTTEPDQETGEVGPVASPLVEAVCAVMAEVGYVTGTGRNTDQGYGYTSDADLLRPLQAAMSSHGLMLSPVSVEMIREPRMKEGRNGPYQSGSFNHAIVTYQLRHRAGEVIQIQAPGCGFDTLDKAPYKAMTGAYKYALRQLFAIPTGDDAERNQPKERKQDNNTPAVSPEDRDKFRKAWHATLGRLAAANLTPKLSKAERHIVQRAAWGVDSFSDVADADISRHFDTLRSSDDSAFAAWIRQLIGADA